MGTLEFAIRPFQESDCLEHLTRLLHASYAPLADAGMKFLATHQDVDVTESRVVAGWCFVADIDGETVGTITLYPTNRHGECEYYRRPGVAHFGQFAVRTDLQGNGIGTALEMRVEREARERGYRFLALDTAETAERLIERYAKRGFQFVQTVSWVCTNYRSVVLAKQL